MNFQPTQKKKKKIKINALKSLVKNNRIISLPISLENHPNLLSQHVAIIMKK